jgi:hypothetical protein
VKGCLQRAKVYITTRREWEHSNRANKTHIDIVIYTRERERELERIGEKKKQIARAIG